MHHRQNLLGKMVFNAGIRSLQSATDETGIAQWVLEFMAD